jgi:C-terminal processing protease CtpA/Prc
MLVNSSSASAGSIVTVFFPARPLAKITRS